MVIFLKRSRDGAVRSGNLGRKRFPMLGHDGGAFWRQNRRVFTGGWGWDLCPLISSQFMVDRCYLKAGRGLSKYFFGNVSELFYPREP